MRFRAWPSGAPSGDAWQAAGASHGSTRGEQRKRDRIGLGGLSDLVLKFGSFSWAFSRFGHHFFRF